jgi:glycerophosphoryl diester phosphodiesterase
MTFGLFSEVFFRRGLPMPLFDLQGHRGALGLKPENTLPAFEIALDLGVSSVETDVHLTRDAVPILVHDPQITPQLFRRVPRTAVPEPGSQPLVRTLTLAQLRGYRADQNPDPGRFPEQEATVTPLASFFAQQQGYDPYGPPTLADLFAFAQAYAGDWGAAAGKTTQQQARAGRVRFDLELKRVPFRPRVLDDDFDGSGPGLLERRLVEVVQQAGMVERTQVRSFDHRSVVAVRRLEPRLTTAILMAAAALLAPGQLARQAGAQVYAPYFEFLDQAQVQQAQAEGVRVVPWTVNEPEAWECLLGWGVDGITTDYPDRLAAVLRARGISF